MSSSNGRIVDHNLLPADEDIEMDVDIETVHGRLPNIIEPVSPLK